jgi:hypothetical protein
VFAAADGILAKEYRTELQMGVGIMIGIATAALRGMRSVGLRLAISSRNFAESERGQGKGLPLLPLGPTEIVHRQFLSMFWR